MLHIHKNTDGSYHISLEVVVEGRVVLAFDGDFMRLEDGVERAKDESGVTIDLPVNV